jgi:hypothetical protein
METMVNWQKQHDPGLQDSFYLPYLKTKGACLLDNNRLISPWLALKNCLHRLLT